MKTLLGEGILSWPREERVSDRYGMVGLLAGPEDHDWLRLHGLELEGKRGKLFVHVEATHTSKHIGDHLRGLFPSTPTVGETVMLGEGQLFFEDGDMLVGVSPDDGRDYDRLDVTGLYRVHGQTVELWFEETQIQR